MDRHRHGVDQVYLGRLEGGNARKVLRDNLDHQVLRGRRVLLVPVIRKPLEADLVLDLARNEAPRAATHRMPLELVAADLQDVVLGDCEQPKIVGGVGGIALLEMQAEMQRVDGFERLHGLLQVRQPAVFAVAHSLESEGEVLGGERIAVVEFDARVQLHVDDRLARIGIDLVGLCQPRLAIGIRRDRPQQLFEHLADEIHIDAGRHLYRIERGGFRAKRDGDGVRVARLRRPSRTDQQNCRDRQDPVHCLSPLTASASACARTGPSPPAPSAAGACPPPGPAHARDRRRGGPCRSCAPP